jgi:hypothetical protein
MKYLAPHLFSFEDMHASSSSAAPASPVLFIWISESINPSPARWCSGCARSTPRWR